MIKYHSAMKQYGGISPTKNILDKKIYSNNGNYVLQHDICDMSFPYVFRKADAIFSVMSWRNGYKKFVNNTIANETNFKDYCEGLHRTIIALNIPSFIISNRTFVNSLVPERIVPIKFDRFKSNDVVAIWNYYSDIPTTSTELMKWIGSSYDTVLDFCCGYGEIASYTKHFICSDINTGCLDYVKNHYLFKET